MGKYQAEIEPGNPGMSQSVTLDFVGRDKRVLDVGCAGGYVARSLNRQGCIVSGVDIDADSAAEAKDDLERLVIGDLDELDLVAEFGEESFDAVIFGDVLEHLRHPVAVVRASRRLIRPRGMVVVSVPNVAHGDLQLHLLSGHWDYREVGLLDDTHLRFFTVDTVPQLLAEAGLLIGDMRRVRLPLFGTELGVRPEDYPAEVVDFVRAQPEHETYQFVVQAFRDDVDARMSGLSNTLRERELAVASLSAALDAARSEAAKHREHALAEIAGLRAEAARWRQAEHALRTSRTVRWATTARRALGAARGVRR